MKYYKGIIKNVDEPRNGGEYVKVTGNAHEKHNFYAVEVDGQALCMGFFETKSTNSKSSNQLLIEKIEEVPLSANSVGNVLVVWVAKYHDNRNVVVGWYKNVTVFRYYESIHIDGYQNDPHYYNIMALAEDCTLLSDSKRNVHIWSVPRKNKNRSFGFGQANVGMPVRTPQCRLLRS